VDQPVKPIVGVWLHWSDAHRKGSVLESVSVADANKLHSKIGHDLPSESWRCAALAV